VVIDSRLETPPLGRMFEPARRVLIYFAVPDGAKQAALQDAGATLVHLPGPDGKVDLAAMLRDLAVREVNELHVEAGHKLNGSLVREGLVDELLVYLAPRLLGPGRDMAAFGPIGELSQALSLQFRRVDPIGPDLRIVARVSGRDSF
jgi:diaminohydroxyphosphoribosylaminopyrimidine deaminase/5-amino-6-(5-phosphoribosylamino)uracil reductase